MAVTDSELAAILDHCRSLIDAADQFEHAARARADRAIAAMRAWDGPHRDEFDFRFRGEADDLGDRVRRLRVEADAWAQVWADTVNETNRRRREDAVERISASRGVGESFVDLFVGDDSAGRCRPRRRRRAGLRGLRRRSGRVEPGEGRPPLGSAVPATGPRLDGQSSDRRSRRLQDCRSSRSRAPAGAERVSRPMTCEQVGRSQ